MSMTVDRVTLIMVVAKTHVYTTRMQFNDLIPEFYVRDYAQSLHFYTVVLGFTLEYDRHDPLFGFLSYQGCQLMIQQIEPTDTHTGPLDYPFGRGINFQIHTPDIAAIVTSLQHSDHPLKRGLQDHWRHIGNNILSGSREMHVLDPDGYFLRFCQDLGNKSATED